MFYLPARLKTIIVENNVIIITGPFMKKIVYDIKDFREVKSEWLSKGFRIYFNDGKDFLFYPSSKYISPFYFKSPDILEIGGNGKRPNPIVAINNDILDINDSET
jgi:hypothetical protein